MLTAAGCHCLLMAWHCWECDMVDCLDFWYSVILIDGNDVEHRLSVRWKNVDDAVSQARTMLLDTDNDYRTFTIVFGNNVEEIRLDERTGRNGDASGSSGE